MASEVGGQFTFDDLFHEAEVEADPPWTGAPLHFTTGYHSPAEFDAAFEHWQFLHKGQIGAYAASRMWHRAIAVPGGVSVGAHGFDMFTADLRCEPWTHDGPHDGCSCVGGLTYQSICEPCGWHDLSEDENGAVEAWHDHAVPGWRDLPIVPAHIPISDGARLTMTARAWIVEHYPPEFQFVGAPILTERSGGHRHVPGRSPWGGYDLSHTAVDPERPITKKKPPRRAERRTRRPVRASMPDAAPEPRRTSTLDGGHVIGT